MTKKSEESNDAGAHTCADTLPGTVLTVVVTPHEMVPPERTSLASRVGNAVAKGTRIASRAAGAASMATSSAARATAQTTSKVAGSTAKSVATAAREATKAAASAGRAIERTAGSAAEASARAVTNVATSAAQTTTRAGATVATAASATFHFVGDLNGDGRCDLEELRIVKGVVSKAAVELGGEALELSKATLRHPMLKDAAAAALVGGAVAAAVPFVGVPLGAAVGAATVLVPRGTGKVLDKALTGASRATKEVMSTSKGKRKPGAKPQP